MHSHKPLVLVADDEHHAVVLLRRVLERDGFAVESASDGMTALQKARTLKPDLILMDVQMPRMNGFEVTVRLREDPDTARIPVIFVTAAAREPADVAHGLQLGADDYIRKPYDYHELLARATSKMRARQLEDHLQRRSTELEALVRIGGEFNQRLELHELTELILIIARDEFEADYAELYLFDEQQQPILYRDLTSGVRTVADAASTLACEGGLANRVFVTGEPILISDQQDLAFGCPDADELRSGMAAPLKHHGTLLGILTIAHRQLDHFSDSHLRMLRSIGEQASLAVRNAQLHAALQSYAQTLESRVEARTHELRTAEAQLIQSEKLAALGRLAAGIAHEVNNPLQPILNCLEDAIEDTQRDREVDLESLKVAEREVQRIKTIVSRLLDFSRPSTSEAVTIDLRHLIEEVLALTRRQLERNQIVAHVHSDTALHVTGAPAQLKQVFLNLVLNAMESMPGGGDMSIITRPAHEGAEVDIIDSGTGMDEKTVIRIFEPFFSTKSEGTGLGLSVTYGIVQSHGGTIEIKSEPGKGSCFTVWLPYQRPTGPAA